MKRTCPKKDFWHRAAIRVAPLLLPLAAAVVLVVWLAWPLPTYQDSVDPRTTEQLAAAIASGAPRAVATAVYRARTDTSDLVPLITVLLQTEAWQYRRTVCEMVAARGDASLLPILVPMASDADWRVRNAAFDALNQFRELPGEMPLKDTTLATREGVLLAWLDRHDLDAPTPLGPDLCELYAGTWTVEYGQPLAARCLACHVGRQRKPFDDNARCVKCHPRVHSQWASSAHAQSLTHLVLTTVSPETRQVEKMDFGGVRGISCTQCHRVLAGPSSPASDTQRGEKCPWTFDTAVPQREVCRSCHRFTTNEWLAWRDGTQPRQLDWPPGKLDLQHRGDTRDCVDCHMPPRDAGNPEQGGRQHTWAVRRDVRAMREALDLRAETGSGKDGKTEVRITLTNLAGHGFPTGTRRRGLIVEVGPADGTAWHVAATLSPVRPGRPRTGTSPALAPGEQRHLSWTVGNADQQTAIRLVYARDLFDARRYRNEIAKVIALPALR